MRKIKILLISFILIASLNVNSFALSENDEEVKDVSNAVDFCQEVSELTEAHQLGSERLLIISEDPIDLSQCEGVVKAISHGDVFYVVQFDSSKNASSARSIILKQDGVESVEFDGAMSMGSAYSADSRHYYSTDDHYTWGADCIGIDEYIPYAGNGHGRTIVVAVVDSGIDEDHVMFSGRRVEAYDFVRNDNMPDDENGHGTHVTGIIADCTKELSNVRFMPVKVFDEHGEGDISVVASGILYAIENDADLINLSLGGRHSSYVEKAVMRAFDADVPVFVAAGNEGLDLYDLRVCPAHIGRSITIGSIGESRARASYSNYGKGLDYMAPGTNITSAGFNNTLETFSGTSMAAPHAAACACLFLNKYGDLTTSQICSLLTRSCDKKSDTKLYGKGIINLRNLVASISDQNVKLSYTSCTYTGKYRKPTVTVSRNGASLFKGEDYSVNYSDNLNVGTARAVIVGKGSYSGRAKKSFKILPKGTPIRSLKPARRGFTVKWAKQSEKMSIKRITGYQVQYAQNSHFTSGRKTVTIKGYKKTSKKISKLKSKKKYYVRVRTYMKCGDKVYYSKWSKAKSIKVR
ncbi:MAG: S8 family serine peptidase [Mogibacterium sp.]|nr:S8 family serine peptidase [Mogibacterium sp.]